MYKSINVLGYNVFTGSLSDIDFQRKVLINTFSPNSYGLSVNDKECELALKNTDVLVVDGMGIALGSIILNRKNIRKIAGQDCFDHLLEQANRNGWKVFFLGSSAHTLQKIVSRLALEYPAIKASTYSPPYKETFSEEDNRKMHDIINSFEPDVLFVGLTAPKQEKWAYRNRNLVNARVISTVGNVFDWYAGNSRRPAGIWIRLRLEWFVRILMRPEIFRRNTRNQMLFLRDLFFHIFFIKRIK